MQNIQYEQTVTNSNTTAYEIIECILLQRRISDTQTFLHPDHPTATSLASFGFKKEVVKLIRLLSEIKKNKEAIVVYTDYDADGITAGAIMWETLHKLGFSVFPYVPHRQTEGYGFSRIGIDCVEKTFHPKLIISVDHGISAVEQIEYAKKRGIQIIVTDHHSKPKKIPCADLIFHIPELSGSGVSYFVAKEIHSHFQSSVIHKESLAQCFTSDYLALAAIGTVADLVPLTNTSRSIVYYGLRAFQKTRRMGLKHILSEAKIENKAITPYEIGFMIAPRINAVGRLEHALDALRLLCTTSDEKAKRISSHMGQLNRHRQDMVKTSIDEAKVLVELFREKKGGIPNLIVLQNEQWNEGIIGLIAGKIADLYYRPTIVLTKSEHVWKGSARSIKGFHIADFLRSEEKLLNGVGGHEQAAGFSVNEKNRLSFISSLEKRAKTLLAESDFIRSVRVDINMPLICATLRLAEQLEKLQPFGIGNPQPLFASKVLVKSFRSIGKNGNHLKLIVLDLFDNTKQIDCIFFSPTDEEKQILQSNKEVEIIYLLEVNQWNGSKKVQGRIQYIQI